MGARVVAKEGVMVGLLEKNKSPEQNAQVLKFVENGMRVIHSPETRDVVLERLKEGNPVDAVSEVAILVIDKMETDATAQQTKISDEAKLVGGLPLLLQIVEVGEAAGIFQMTDEEKTQAAAKAYKKYILREMEAGRINKEELIQGAMNSDVELPPELNSAADHLKGSEDESYYIQKALGNADTVS